MSGPDLTSFLRQEARGAAAEANGCGRFVARWYEARTGRKPLSGLLTRSDAHEAIGVYRAMCRAVAEEGLPRTDRPGPGDIGLVRAGNAVLAAICTGQGWASMVADRLLITRRVTVLRAWRLA